MPAASLSKAAPCTELLKKNRGSEERLKGFSRKPKYRSYVSEPGSCGRASDAPMNQERRLRNSAPLPNARFVSSGCGTDVPTFRCKNHMIPGYQSKTQAGWPEWRVWRPRYSTTHKLQIMRTTVRWRGHTVSGGCRARTQRVPFRDTPSGEQRVALPYVSTV
jgi:hypothetical protein